MTERVLIHPTAALTARSAGMRLLLTLLERQALRERTDIALTGGSLGIGMLAAVRDEALLGAIDWSGVHVWWGDERFAPDTERNASQAASALLDYLPLPVGNVHEVARPGEVASVEEAAAQYARELEGVSFAVVILGVGPDGHVASLFPRTPQVRAGGSGALAVSNSPKPPPERVTLTREQLQGEQVWFVAAGQDKAGAVAAGLRGELPVGLVRGRKSTVWLLDAAAAGL